METNNISPFLIGICGGPLSGKSSLANEISSSIGSEYKVQIISLDNYYKSLTPVDTKNLEKYNFYRPEALDFDLLYSNIYDLLNKKPTKLPKFDKSTHSRTENQEEIKNCEVIIIEGMFSFYDERIRNLIDLKIFIDIDKDIQLSKIIIKDIFDSNRELRKIINEYHNFIKPSYNKYILPTMKIADIILQKSGKDISVIEIVGEYLKMQLNKMRKNDQQDLFSFSYEIIDPKYQYYDGKILVENVQIFVSFIKDVFQDFIINKLDEQLNTHIREKMVNMLSSLLIRDIKKKNNNSEIEIDVDLLLFEKDPKKYNFKNYKNIFYFKTSILSDNDIEELLNILKDNKDCHLFIFTIFLAPKYAELLLNKEINTVLFYTIYFSDFFIKFDDIIKNNDGIFNNKKFENIFLEKIKNDFNYQKDEEDLYDALQFHSK